MPRFLTRGRVPPVEISSANRVALNRQGGFVLYWLTTSRRTTWNYGLDRAAELAGELRKPLLIVETLNSGTRWASDRHHAFVLGGMADN